ncbi:KamA family protein [Natronoflexus pectinivorans]|uniref:KamA family protein n=2 Tax=Natronoflexus pectinivorans TaxID=682526 RepID=A0A4R2GP13_9BACT|nr:KamA family protein [Natronoflexus pectinivorans]
MPMKYQIYTSRNYRQITQFKSVRKEHLRDIDVVASVLPFKTNNYVVDELIDWDNYQNDPIFILNFPQRGMLQPNHFETMARLIDSNADAPTIKEAANKIRHQLNPHPAGQSHNVPEINGQKLTGAQHKYDETMLFFPTQGQTCHAYCTFCFRWPQFTGMDNLKFAMKEVDDVIDYIKAHPEITDLLITGGDPMVMNANILDTYISRVLEAKIPHLQTIRIGTKSLAFWPYRYISDPDAEDVLKIFEKVTKAGITLAFMAHFNHVRELETEAVQEAVRRIRATGAQIRTQSPLLNHINASSKVWSDMWTKQVKLGMIPYYMFVARDTGAQEYFGVSLTRAWDIFRNAYNKVSGIARTVRGPSMSCTPGKVKITGVTEIQGEKVFVLEFIQGRNREWVNRPFFAKYNPKALWMDDLEPAFGKKEFFFEEELAAMLLD